VGVLLNHWITWQMRLEAVCSVEKPTVCDVMSSLARRP
jgi:hypothetical protein